ncbi:MAG: hypothetical protein ACI8V4_002695 [Ilumatobacter sp.]|jgi:hypothetical protein
MRRLKPDPRRLRHRHEGPPATDRQRSPSLSPHRAGRHVGQHSGRPCDGRSQGTLGLSLFTTLGPVDRGVAVTRIAILTVFGVTATTPTSGPARLLGFRPLVRLGDLSYATYLWHWTLIIILERTLEIRQRTVAVVVVLAATALAKLSMDLLEAPIRQRSIEASRRNAIITVVVAVVATFALGLGVVSVVSPSDRNQSRAADRIDFS